jgi:hypothetical protein
MWLFVAFADTWAIKPQHRFFSSFSLMLSSLGNCSSGVSHFLLLSKVVTAFTMVMKALELALSTRPLNRPMSLWMPVPCDGSVS